MRHVSNVQVERVFASCSAQHAFFLSTDGDLYAHGENGYGQCGISSANAITEALAVERSAFVPQLGSNERVASAAVGAGHSLIVTTHGSVYAAGDNSMGQCGLGDMASAAPFRRLAKFDSPAVEVACGHDFSLVRTENGGGASSLTVYAMGSAAYGQLGTGEYDMEFRTPEGSFRAQRTPAKVALPEVRQIACGTHHALAYVTANQCRCRRVRVCMGRRLVWAPGNRQPARLPRSCTATAVRKEEPAGPGALRCSGRVCNRGSRPAAASVGCRPVARLWRRWVHGQLPNFPSASRAVRHGDPCGGARGQCDPLPRGREARCCTGFWLGRACCTWRAWHGRGSAAGQPYAQCGTRKCTRHTDCGWDGYCLLCVIY